MTVDITVTPRPSLMARPHLLRADTPAVLVVSDVEIVRVEFQHTVRPVRTDTSTSPCRSTYTVYGPATRKTTDLQEQGLNPLHRDTNVEQPGVETVVFLPRGFASCSPLSAANEPKYWVVLEFVENRRA